MSYPQIKKSGDRIKNSFTKDVNSVICNPIFEKKKLTEKFDKHKTPESSCVKLQILL